MKGAKIMTVCTYCDEKFEQGLGGYVRMTCSNTCQRKQQKTTRRARKEYRCLMCDGPLFYSGRGRKPKYCSKECSKKNDKRVREMTNAYKKQAAAMEKMSRIFTKSDYAALHDTVYQLKQENKKLKHRIDKMERDMPHRVLYMLRHMDLKEEE